jgi:hypothetical protein
VDESVFQFGIRAIKEGLSANESLRQLRAAGMGIRRQDWLTLMREVRLHLETQGSGQFYAAWDRKPSGNELLIWSAPSATGFMQYINIWVKDRTTGEISIRPYGLRTDDLMTHGDAIETAIDQFGRHAPDYGETILGASYGSTYIFGPGG